MFVVSEQKHAASSSETIREYFFFCVEEGLKLRISQCLKKGFNGNYKRTQKFCLVGADPEAQYNLFDFEHFVMRNV